MMQAKLGVTQRELLIWIYQRTAEVWEAIGGQVGFVSPWSGMSKLDRRPSVHWRNLGFSRSESSSMSRALRQLERRGLVERQNTVSGGSRTTNVMLTDAGFACAKALTIKEASIVNTLGIEP